MHRSRFQTPGWAAFGRKHREMQGSGTEGAFNPCQTISNETYLGLMESSNNAHSSENSVLFQSLPTRSFSSVVRTSMPVEFPLLKAHPKLGAANVNIDGDQHVVTVKSNDNPAGMLKDIHSWADQHLIEDILAAVDNDVEQASIILKEMISSDSKTKNKQPGPFGMCSSGSGSVSEGTDIFLEKGNTFVDNNLSDNSHKDLIVKQFYIPTEPDWEEDDVYLSHRQEALKMMRYCCSCINVPRDCNKDKKEIFFI